MKSSETISKRLDIRLNITNKVLIEKAALLAEQTLTDFILSSSLRSAQEIIERTERLRLSDRDRDQFLQTLDDITPPNKALKKAARRFNARYKK
ncbi:MAG: DUF1778 domain-containing protein [Deltaproteobacteria bacterium]|nr:DUF1778 domain-containing protein [Deltaproteobacteria bacterium]